jgi:glycerol uptake facilitator-like aquaporin
MAVLREETAAAHDESSESEAGLLGSQIGADVPRAPAAEVVGTFMLVFTATAVAVAGALDRPTVGSPYDSLAVALAFGADRRERARPHLRRPRVNPAVTTCLAAGRRLPWRFVPTYGAAHMVGGCLGALATWAVLGHQARAKRISPPRSRLTDE